MYCASMRALFCYLFAVRARPSVLCLNAGFVLLPVGLAPFNMELFTSCVGYVYHQAIVTCATDAAPAQNWCIGNALGSLVKQISSRVKQLEDTLS